MGMIEDVYYTVYSAKRREVRPPCGLRRTVRVTNLLNSVGPKPKHRRKIHTGRIKNVNR